MKPASDFGVRGRASSRRWPWLLIGLLATGVVLRGLTLLVPSVQHPDEIYQYLEAAHRMVFGYGVVPWEYRVGMRSWLFPTLLAGPMALGGWIAPDSGLYLLLPRLVMMLASATIILSAWTIGARISRRHAVAAAIVAATWYELIGIAAHPIGESAGLVAAFGAAALMFGSNTSRARFAWAGVLLALGCVLRFQFGPALVVLAVFGGGRDWRGRWLPMIAGGGTVLLISALIDIAHGALPFAWLTENFIQNIVLDKAAQFGTAPPLAYLGALGTAWRWGTVPILVAAYAGMKRQPALFWAALVHLVFHSLIAHKEYRFILLTDGFAVVLAAIGTVDLADSVARRFGPQWAPRLLAAALLVWLAGSATLASLEWNRPLWTARSASLAAFDGLRRRPALCGVAILGLPVSEFGGYAALHRNVPIYLLDTAQPNQRAAAARLARAYDMIVATPHHASDIPAGFASGGCRSTGGEYIGNYVHPSDVAAVSGICVYHRPGACPAGAQQAAAPFAINTALAAHGM